MDHRYAPPHARVHDTAVGQAGDSGSISARARIHVWLASAATGLCCLFAVLDRNAAHGVGLAAPRRRFFPGWRPASASQSLGAAFDLAFRLTICGCLAVFGNANHTQHLEH
jgi:hypothetical protein